MLLQVRLQRPTISAEMSFLLAVVKFYLPDFAIGSITPVPFRTQDILLTGTNACFITASTIALSTSRGTLERGNA